MEQILVTQSSLPDISEYIDEIKDSIDMLDKAGYYKLCSEDDKVVICHNDLAYHNILINNGEAYFIDFDYVIIDLKVHDLCNFISRCKYFGTRPYENTIAYFCICSAFN